MAELSGGGHVVGIVATGAAHGGGWATGVAARVAEAWSASGIRLILADGALADPRLHTEVGVENGEGVSDALVFGASVRRVARRVEGQAYFVVSAGTVVADPSEAMSGGRWAHLCAGFRAAGVMLAVYLNADDPSTALALQEVSHVLVVAREGEDIPAAVMDCAAPVIGVVGIAGEDLPAAPALGGSEAADHQDAAEPIPETADEPQDVEAIVADYDDSTDYADFADSDEALLEPVDVEAGSPADEAPMDGEKAARSPLDDGESHLFEQIVPAENGEGEVAALEEILQETEGAKGGGRRTALLVVLLLVIVGALAADWFGYVEIPGLSPFGPTTAAPLEGAPPVTPPAVVTDQSPIQGYSVALAAYGDAASAQAFLDRLAPLAPDVLFMVVPVEVDGRAFYRALAGPATDSADAAALSQRIASATGSDPAQWVLRPTSQAFDLGEMPDVVAARQRAEEARAIDVPAYVLAVDYTDGSSRFRVYAGAFADEAEASMMLRHLRDSGIHAALADRKGRLPE